jgi:hypothetical protein
MLHLTKASPRIEPELRCYMVGWINTIFLEKIYLLNGNCLVTEMLEKLRHLLGRRSDSRNSSVMFTCFCAKRSITHHKAPSTCKCKPITARFLSPVTERLVCRNIFHGHLNRCPLCACKQDERKSTNITRLLTSGSAPVRSSHHASHSYST